MDKFKNFNIQKFNGSNFQLWKYQMDIIFRAEKLSDVINGTTGRPEETGEPQNQWDEKNSKAMLLISTSMEFDQLQVIMSCKTAPLMWTRLKSIHEQRSAINKVTLKQHFFNYKMSDSDSIASHISKIESMAQALADVEEPIGDIDKIAKVLGSLPVKFNSFVTAWDSYAEEKQTFDNLTIRLLKEEQSLNQTDEMTSAFAAVNVSCSKYKGLSDSNNQSNSQFKKNNKKNFECYFCHKKGHFKSECRKRLAKLKENSNSKLQALSAEVKNLSAIGCEDIWLADSAASRHMTSHKEWFTTFKQLPNKDINIQIGDNSFVYAEGIGSISVKALVNGELEQCVLENTLYVPNLKKNLFSVGAATSKNLKVTFDNRQIEIFNRSKLVATGAKMSNQCYQMFFKLTKMEQANFASSSSAVLWHERLGHVNFDTLRNMADKGLIPNLKLTDSDKFFCELCQLGKMHRKSFTSNSQLRTTKPGEVIHTDLCGKMPQSSIGGSNYFAIFKDECTSYRLIYFLKNKSDVASIFPEIDSLIERQTGNRIRVLRSDNGTEYVNEKLQNYLKTKGIIHETSSPYTPEQNGRAEREIRSIVESARTMLLDSNLPETLWAEAVNTAVYTLNRRPGKSNNDKTPYEKWFNKAVSIKHMKKFGSVAFVHVPKQFRTKFKPKSKKVIMVGYDGYSQNYRLFDPVSKKVNVSRDVVFNEVDKYSNVKPEKHHFVYEWNIAEICEENDAPLVEENHAPLVEENNVLLPDVFEDEEEYFEEEKETEKDSDEPKNSSRRLRNRNSLQKPPRFKDTNFTACSATIDEPQTFEEAMSSTESNFWIGAMEEEMSSLFEKETFDLEKLPPDRKAIGCKWVFKIKCKSDGSIDRFKARLCAKGYSQKAGIDYGETFSPVVRYESIRILLALTAVRDLEITQFDVKTAFLNGDLEEEIYMVQPQGFISDRPDLVYKLKKSLYGLKQSPRCWNQKFVNFLRTFHFKELNADKCVFHTNYKNEDVFLAIYVDDGLIFSKSITVSNQILAELKSYFGITIQDSNCYVGMEINRNRDKKEIFISQKSYINRLLKRFNMCDCKPHMTPCDPNMQLHSGQSPSNSE